MKNATKPAVTDQGKAIVERDCESGGSYGGYLIMLPDGTIQIRPTPAMALKSIQRWSKQHANGSAVNFLTVEWRDGIEPPAIIEVR